MASNPKHLGAQVGMLLVLHTWGQNLHHHPHVHAVVTGGGLSCDRHGIVSLSPKWVACRPGFFLPVKVLGRLFRGKYLAGLQRAFDRGMLVFPQALDGLAVPQAFRRWLSPLYRKEWVVYAKRPFGGAGQVLKYLARYTHRVAIANSRLLDVADGTVTFGYKDYAANSGSKVMTQTADEFLRRFVQHVLPKGFYKIRHCGLLANRQRGERLPLPRIAGRSRQARRNHDGLTHDRARGRSLLPELRRSPVHAAGVAAGPDGRPNPAARHRQRLAGGTG
jgi:hypothetical protein